MTKYIDSVLRFADHFLRIIALALRAKEDAIINKVDRFRGLSALYYPLAQ